MHRKLWIDYGNWHMELWTTRASERGGAALGKKSEKGLGGALSPYLVKDDNVAKRGQERQF
jgi:hypothetical protein